MKRIFALFLAVVLLMASAAALGESNLMPGKQRLVPGTRPDPAVSITDGCIGWEETAELIREAHRALAGRFR